MKSKSHAFLSTSEIAYCKFLPFLVSKKHFIVAILEEQKFIPTMMNNYLFYIYTSFSFSVPFYTENNI